MSSASYGIVVEGVYDVPVYEELIRKISSPDAVIISRDTGGVERLKKLFPVLLKDFEHVRSGRPVDKPLIIRDSGGRNPRDLERELRDRIRGWQFSFPTEIQFHIVHRAMETWLLADTAALNYVAVSRRGRQVPAVQGALEDIVDPKTRLKRLLSVAGLPYDPEVCRQIAKQAALGALRNRCPSFSTFEQKIIDC